MTPNNFRVKSGLTVGTTISGGNTSITGFVNATSTVNASGLAVGTAFIANSTGAFHTGTVNAATVSVGSSFVANTSRVVIGTAVGLQANGGIGTAGQVLHSNGTTVYWAADDGITSIATANGISGGTITSTGTIGVTTGSTLTVNTSGIHVNSALAITSLALSGALSGVTTAAMGNTTITGLLAAGNTTITGFVNATSSVNAASHTVGSSFVANSTGTTVNVASWGAAFRASNSTNFSGIRWDDTGGTIRAGMYRYDNSDLTISIYDNTGTYQAAPVIISASTGTVTLSRLATTNGVFSGAVSGITTLAAGNTTVTGFANITSTLQVGGISTFSGNVVLGSVGVSANGGFGTAGQVLHSNGTATYWAADDNSGGTVTSIATANGLSGGTITTSGTIGVTSGSTLTVNTTGIHVNSALSIASLALSGDLTVTGNLTVSGTRTYVNTTTLDVGDNIFTLNADLGAAAPTQDAGMEIMRGTSANVQFMWDETNDRWSTNGQPLAVSSLVATGAASGITTLAAGNTTITGFVNATSSVNAASLSVGTSFIANGTQVTLGSVALSANGSVGLAGQTLHSNGTATYWSTDDNAGGTVTNIATANGLTGGTITTTGTLGVATGSTLTVNTTGIHVNSALSITSLALAGAASGITTLAAGNTTITGFANVTSTLQVGGVATFAANANFDSGVLFVDGTNNRVGVNTTSPGYALEVSGSFAATTKSFIIPHPTKPYMQLRYGSLEGPENGVYVRGRLRAGENIIQLPDYWEGLVDEDTYTVNLTPVGKHQELYVEHVASDHIVVGGENIDCFYTVFAERNDVEKLVVEF